jgi:hypothetical protein
MAKQSKNQIALQANEDALAKAHTDLQKAQKKVRDLTQRIPELQRAVDSLRVLCGEKPTQKTNETLRLYGNPSPARAVPPPEEGTIGEERDLPLPGVIPDESIVEKAKKLTASLPGVGSIPATSGEPEESPDPETDPDCFLRG